jgi:hypothetical protein
MRFGSGEKLNGGNERPTIIITDKNKFWNHSGGNKKRVKT